MLTDASTTSNDLTLTSMTWSNVFLGTIVGAIGGVVISLFLSQLWALAMGSDPFILFIFLFFLFVSLWAIPSFGGACGGFLGGAVGLTSGHRKLAPVIGLFSGLVIGAILIFWLLSYLTEPTIIVLLELAACGLAGAFGGYYSTTAHASRVAVYLKRVLPAAMIVLLATSITILSFAFVQPQDCRPPGTCLIGEQRAGFPIPVLQDNNNSSPLSGLGVLGPEDTPYPGAFVLDVIFWSAVLWFLWKARGWIISRNKDYQPR